MRKLGLFLLVAMMAAVIVPAAVDAQTTVPGHENRDGVVTGRYNSVYAYDASGDYYWDLGDGRVQGTVGSIDQLDADTLTTCDYKNHYRGDFGDDPFMDNGWIMNNIRCHGYDGNSTYTYLIVHRSDPRFDGNGSDTGWGPDWEYQVLTVGGHDHTNGDHGNIVRPQEHVGN